MGVGDLFSARLVENPWEFYEEIREKNPIHWDNYYRVWVLTDYSDQKAVLESPSFAAIEMAASISEIGKRAGRDFSRLATFLDAVLLFINGSEHARGRRTLSRVMNRVKLSMVRESVGRIAKDLESKLAGASSFDGVADFADPFPQLVMAEILGIPPEDVPTLSECLAELTLIFDPATLPVYEQANIAVTKALDLLRCRIDGADRAGADSGLTFILKNVVGSGDERLEKAAATVLFAYRVGAESSIGYLGTLIRILVEQKQILELARENPSIRDAIAEEILRNETSVQRVGRVAVERTEVNGTPIEKGDRILLLLGAANRDPAEFLNPEKLIFDRNRSNLVFGAGRRYCLGASLARLEGRATLEVMLTLPQLERDGMLTWYGGRSMRRLTSLPLRATR